MHVEQRFVDLECWNGTEVQMGKPTRQFAVDPVRNLSVVLPRRVAPDHQLVAVPAVALRHEVWERLPIWIGLPRSGADD